MPCLYLYSLKNRQYFFILILIFPLLLIKSFMMHSTLIFFLISLTISQTYPDFETYVQHFSKTYSTPAEKQMRRNIYYQNTNRLYQLSIQLQIQTGVNKFTDRTPQQIQRFKNNKQSRLSRSVTPHFSIQKKLGVSSSLDWRAKGAVTSVKDQDWCGSCWAFATAAYCQSSLIINNGFKNEIDLSQQYLLECTQQSDCKGGYPAYALLQVITHGIPKQQTYPYNPAFMHEGICETRKSLKVKGKQVYVYFSLKDIQMIYLLQTSPIIVGVASQDWQFYKGGIMKCRANSTEDHAVLLVGYTPQYWIIKNQWGTSWGEKGFMRISRNPKQNCLMGVQVDVLFYLNIKLSLIALISIILSIC